MESQSQPINPWSFQQLEQGYGSENEEENSQAFTKNIRFRRNSSDRRHYSYASSTTLAPDNYDDDKDLGYDDDPEDSSSLHYFSSPQKQTPDLDLDVQSTAIATTTTITSESHVSSSGHEESLPNLSVNNNNNNNTNISDSGVGLEGDVIEHLVQKLQSEVADTRAIVFDLSSRLNAAENSNQHIVDELKMLLADAEGTLVGSDESDSEGSSPKHGPSSISDEDSNIVYNRICSSLQSLISEAQSALARSSSASSSSNPGASFETPQIDRRFCRRQKLLPQGQRLSLSSEHSLEDGDTSSQLDGNCGHSSCRTSRRSSLSNTRSEKSYFYNSLLHTSLSNPSTQSLPLPNSLSSRRLSSSSSIIGKKSGRDTFSRMMWKEKQMEQYERYRRSCDRVSLELNMLLNDTIVDGINIQEDWEYLRSQGASASSSPTQSSAPSSSTPPSTHVAVSTLSSLTTTTDNELSTIALLPSLELPPSNKEESSSAQLITPQTTPIIQSDALVKRERRLNSRVERLHRLYQNQILSPQVRAPQLPRRKTDNYPGFGIISSYQQSHISSHSSISAPPTHRGRSRQSLSTQRQFRSQGVGSSTPPKSVLVQLYELWKQTWLRRRIMHVLTGSLEIMLILWVVYKLSDTALAWMGIHSLKGGPQLWLKYIYGEREGEGSTAAKELYLKIRKQGLRTQNLRLRKEKESQDLLKEFMASEASMMGMGTSTPFTPSGMVWTPLSRLLSHAVSGIVLAYLADRVRYFAKRL